MSDASVTVYRSHDRIDAELVAELLDDAEIPAQVFGDRNALLVGAGSFAFELRVDVPEAHSERARELIHAYLRDENGSGEVAEPAPQAGPAAQSELAGSAPPAVAIPDPGPDAPPAPATEVPAPGSPEVASAPEVEAAAQAEPVPAEPEEPARDTPLADFSADPVWGPLLALAGFQILLLVLTGGRQEALLDVGAPEGWPGLRDGYRLMLGSFLHFGAFHLLTNLFGLILYGWAAIRMFGLARAGAVYLTAALVSGVATALRFDVVAAGSSGCVFALIALVLVGKARLALRANVARWRTLVKVGGWAAFAVPPSLYANWVAHVSGLATGALFAAALAFASEEGTPGFRRRGRLFAWISGALLAVPWLWRLAAPLYAPCLTGDLARCQARCAANDPVSCWDLSKRELLAGPTEETSDELSRNLEVACAGGIADACHQLGLSLYDPANPLAGDAERALKGFERACEQGKRESCTEAGVLLTSQGEETEGRAFGLFRRACDGGDSRACFYQGWMTSEGRGTELSLAGAADLYQVACDGGQPYACAELAGLLERGDLPSDPKRARALREAACDGGDTDSCAGLDTGRTSGRDRPMPLEPATRHLRDAIRLFAPQGGEP